MLCGASEQQGARRNKDIVPSPGPAALATGEVVFCSWKNFKSFVFILLQQDTNCRLSEILQSYTEGDAICEFCLSICSV